MGIRAETVAGRRAPERCQSPEFCARSKSPTAWNSRPAPTRYRRRTIRERTHYLLRGRGQGGEEGLRNFRLGYKPRARGLAYRIYEQKSRAQSALGYNVLAQSWPQSACLALCGQRRGTGNFAQPGQGRTVTNQAIVDTMVERIVARFQPARILLFGSRARGTDNRWSDVDLLVVMDAVEDKRRAAVAMSRALGDLTVSKDIVVTTPDEIARRGNVVGSVLRAALREGKVVYERR